MTRDEMKAVFRLLVNTYPQFEVTKEKIDIWFKLLKDHNPAIVMRNAERHVLESKFPPTIAELKEQRHESYKSNVLNQIEEWERCAARKQ